MFSREQKQHIASEIEKIIGGLNHPEIDNDNIRFKIHIKGKESWSYADIADNKAAKEEGVSTNPFNQMVAK